MNALTRWEPLRELSRLERRMRRLMGEFPFGEEENEEGTLLTHWRPALDLVESDGQIKVHAELPGLTEDDVEITVEDGRLILRGEKKMEKEEEKENVRWRERRYGSFYRSMRLPSSVDVEKVEATMHDGVLDVTLPKLEEAKGKRIEIKVG